jgi:hypothetical protein
MRVRYTTVTGSEYQEEVNGILHFIFGWRAPVPREADFESAHIEGAVVFFGGKRCADQRQPRCGVAGGGTCP